MTVLLIIILTLTLIWENFNVTSKSPVMCVSIRNNNNKHIIQTGKVCHGAVGRSISLMLD